jgi:hypothetical protein
MAPLPRFIDFEAHLSAQEMMQYVTIVHEEHGKSGYVWFNGMIDTTTGELVTFGVGRITERDGHLSAEEINRRIAKEHSTDLV